MKIKNGMRNRDSRLNRQHDAQYLTHGPNRFLLVSRVVQDTKDVVWLATRVNKIQKGGRIEVAKSRHLSYLARSRVETSGPVSHRSRVSVNQSVSRRNLIVERHYHEGVCSGRKIGFYLAQNPFEGFAKRQQPTRDVEMIREDAMLRIFRNEEGGGVESKFVRRHRKPLAKASSSRALSRAQTERSGGAAVFFIERRVPAVTLFLDRSGVPKFQESLQEIQLSSEIPRVSQRNPATKKV